MWKKEEGSALLDGRPIGVWGELGQAGLLGTGVVGEDGVLAGGTGGAAGVRVAGRVLVQRHRQLQVLLGGRGRQGEGDSLTPELCVASSA